MAKAKPKTRRRAKPKAPPRKPEPAPEPPPKPTVQAGGQPLPPLLPEPDAELWEQAVELHDGTALDRLAREAFADLLMMQQLVQPREAEILGHMAGALGGMPSLIEARGATRGWDAAVAALAQKAAASRERTELPMKRRLGLMLSLHVPELPRGYTVVEAEPCLNLPDDDSLTQPLAQVTVGIEVPGRDEVLRVTAANMADLRQQIADILTQTEET